MGMDREFRKKLRGRLNHSGSGQSPKYFKSGFLRSGVHFFQIAKNKRAPDNLKLLASTESPSSAIYSKVPLIQTTRGRFPLRIRLSFHLQVFLFFFITA